MEELRAADLILARRTRLENSETFDLLVHEERYYRIVITNYFKENKVKVMTNIDDFSKEPLFEYSSQNELLDALFIQAKFIFESFIVQEYQAQEEDFDVEVSVLDLAIECLKMDQARNRLTSFLEQNNIEERFAEEGFGDDDQELFQKLEEVTDQFNECSATLDQIFIDDDILEGIAKEYYSVDKMN